MGYEFTGGGANSHFPINFCMGLITVQRYPALHVIDRCIVSWQTATIKAGLACIQYKLFSTLYQL